MSSASTPQPPVMSSTTVPPPKMPAPAPVSRRNEIYIYGHTMLFYWWPIWFFGFLFALITYWNDHRMVIVPAQSTYEEAQVGDKREGRIIVRGPSGEIPLDKSAASVVGDRFQERVSPHTSI